MSWKTKSIRVAALSLLAAPTTLFAAEPRIIVPSPTPPKVVFESDNASYKVLDRFRNARSSEQIHFQAIETLFPPTPERASVREGYTMVKELVDAQKAATEAAARLDEERAALEAARAELEAQAQAQAEEKWDVEPEEFDYYQFDEKDSNGEASGEGRGAKSAPSAAPKVVNQHHHGHTHANHNHTNNRTAKRTPSRSTGGFLGRLFQR